MSSAPCTALLALKLWQSFDVIEAPLVQPRFDFFFRSAQPQLTLPHPQFSFKCETMLLPMHRANRNHNIMKHLKAIKAVQLKIWPPIFFPQKHIFGILF